MPTTRRQIYSAADEWHERVKPTHHLRLSLHKAKCMDPIGKQHWIQGDEIIYGEVYQRFIRSLSKGLAPNRNVWKRFKSILPNMGCLHGKSGKTDWHLHINLRLPDRVDEEKLLHKIYLTVWNEPWVPHGLDYFHLSAIRSGPRTLSYTMTEGFDHVRGVPWDRKPIETS